ncbi:MAG: hypothetical protein DMF14_02500 [Verrucomicrobia bacterium]|nr:MAG: hypothetical protein DMF14_02500 [Verrucomicrobiota bacterium]
MIAQLNRHQCCGWVGQNRELALPRDRTRHRANSSVVIVINGGDGKGMLVIGALERDHSDKGSSRLSPFRAQARAVRRRGSEARRYPLPPSEMFFGNRRWGVTARAANSNETAIRRSARKFFIRMF